MKASDEGLELIKRHEGLRLTAYKCPAGVWTIGYGHTRGVKAGMGITLKAADALLREDLIATERDLGALCRECGVTLQQKQFDALVSWTFNLGITNLRGSTLWKRICQSTLHPDIGAQWMRWVYAGGTRLKGLENRRKAELNLYLSE